MPRHLWQTAALRRRRVKQRSSHTRERNQRTASAQNGALRSRPEEFRNTITLKRTCTAIDCLEEPERHGETLNASPLATNANRGIIAGTRNIGEEGAFLGYKSAIPNYRHSSKCGGSSERHWIKWDIHLFEGRLLLCPEYVPFVHRTRDIRTLDGYLDRIACIDKKRSND